MSSCLNLCQFLAFSSEDGAEDTSDDDSEELNADVDNDEISTRHEERLKRTRYTGPNGHKPIDHRPPEKLLQKAEKKVARYIERKKVS